MKEIGRTQSYARKVNSGLVISKLRKKDCSATILVEELNLSNAAMSSILKDLEAQGVITQTDSISKGGKGRRQVYYSLNKKYGVFVVVCLSNNRCKIIVSNLKEEVLLKEEKVIDKYDVSVIYEIILKIKELLAYPEYRDLPLRNVFIAIPGKVNSITGEVLLSKHFDHSLFDEKNKITQLFKTHLNAPVIIQNDINMAIIGEQKCGALSSTKDGLLVYVDNGIGASMIIRGEIYNGVSGYAGEIGLMQTTFNNQENYLDEFVSLRAIKNYFSEKYQKELKTQDIVKMYDSNEEVKEYINKTAHLLGKKLKDIVELLNVSHIVIQGRVSYFKNDYLKCIKEEVNKSNNTCEVEYSLLNGDSIFIGAMSEAVAYTVDAITSKTMKAEV